jgi:hypothetical protein
MMPHNSAFPAAVDITVTYKASQLINGKLEAIGAALGALPIRLIDHPSDGLLRRLEVGFLSFGQERRHRRTGTGRQRMTLDAAVHSIKVQNESGRPSNLSGAPKRASLGSFRHEIGIPAQLRDK